jgi:hypothetical protein
LSQRYRITRTFQENAVEQTISLEECKRYFASQSDFTYSPVFTVSGPATTMSIEGDFFMWSYDGLQIPFRHYEGDIYVAVSKEAVMPKMIEVASDLKADITEG